MKRKIPALLLTLAAVLALMLPVRADVIWEPDDSFYSSHRDQCSPVNRGYQAAGSGGTVSIWSAPGGTAGTVLDNGAEVWVHFVYSGDMDWGYAVTGDGKAEGWIPMDDLSLIYDAQAFEEDHQDELTQAENITADPDSFVAYSYPGGPVQRTVTVDRDYMSLPEALNGNDMYTDGSGLRWCRLNYYLGRMDAWICADDPENENLSTNIVSPEPSVSQTRGEPAVQGEDRNSQFLLAGVLVAAAAAVTLVLIIWLGRKRKKAVRPEDTDAPRA